MISVGSSNFRALPLNIIEMRFKMKSSGRVLVTVFGLGSRIPNPDGWFSGDKVLLSCMCHGL